MVCLWQGHKVNVAWAPWVNRTAIDRWIERLVIIVDTIDLKPWAYSITILVQGQCLRVRSMNSNTQ